MLYQESCCTHILRDCLVAFKRTLDDQIQGVACTSHTCPSMPIPFQNLSCCHIIRAIVMNKCVYSLGRNAEFSSHLTIFAAVCRSLRGIVVRLWDVIAQSSLKKSLCTGRFNGTIMTAGNTSVFDRSDYCTKVHHH